MSKRVPSARRLLALVAVVSTFLHVSANTPPVANFEILPSDEGSTTTIVVDASGTLDPDGTIAAYQWTFGDGFSGSGKIIEHTYSKVDTYTITLLVTDDQGRTHWATKSVDLAQPIAPSAASPAIPVRTIATPADVPIGTRVGQRAPDFSLPDLSGGTARLSDFLGRIVLLEFWSSSCPACRTAVPRLEALRRAYEARGLVVVHVITNHNYWEAETFLNETGYTHFVTLREADPIGKPTMRLYGVYRIPHAFLIDRTGVVRFNGHPGLLQEDAIEPWL
jgi:peroxiredoxin